MNTIAAGALLRRVRKRFRARGARRSGSDSGYLFYALALATVTAVFPIARSLVVAAASPSVTDWFRENIARGHGWQLAAVAVGGAFVVLSGIGAVRGPVAPGPFWVTLLAAGPLRARDALRRYFVWSALVLAFACVWIGVLVGVASGGGTGVILRAGLVGGAVALLGACAWLWGQVLDRRSWMLAAGVALAVAVSHLLAVPFTPWGLAGTVAAKNGDIGGGATQSIAPGSTLAVTLLGLTAIAATCTVPQMLDRLLPAALGTQAAAWDRAGSSAGLGDFATALGSVRADPSRLRSARAIRRLPLVPLFFVRDLVGAARTPVRFAVACAALATCGALGSWGSATLSSGVSVAVCAFLAGFGGYLALSALTDGFRHAAVAAGAPALYGVATPRLFALHAAFPTVTAPLLVSIGGAIGGGSTLGAWLIGLVAVAARAFNSLKGPLPVLLATTPISSPVGDPGIIFQLLWRADALLYASAAAAAVHLLARSQPLAATCVAAAAALLLVGGTRRRIARS